MNYFLTNLQHPWNRSNYNEKYLLAVTSILIMMTLAGYSSVSGTIFGDATKFKGTDIGGHTESHNGDLIVANGMIIDGAVTNRVTGTYDYEDVPLEPKGGMYIDDWEYFEETTIQPQAELLTGGEWMHGTLFYMYSFL